MSEKVGNVKATGIKAKVPPTIHCWAYMPSKPQTLKE
jgi:hypothetical protein